MNINLHFSRIEVPEYLRYNIEGYIAEMFGSLANKSNLSVDLYCKKELRTKSYGEKFKCHLEARAPWLRRKIYVQNVGEECWDTIVGAAAIMKKKIFSQKKSNHRQKTRTDWSLTENDNINEQELLI